MNQPSTTFVCDPHTPEFQKNLFEIYRTLRDEYPVYHNPERGLWMVTRYEDVLAVLRDPETYSSAGVDEAQQLQPMLIYMDGEPHRDLRGLVSRGFTPRRVAEMEPHIREIARRLLDELELGDAGSCELMGSFAAQLPSLVIGELIGVPEDRRAAFLSYTEGMIETGPQEHSIAEPAARIHAEFSELLTQRRKKPRDDLMSALLDARIDGKRLSEEELLGFCFLLIVGGNDTTMNLIGNGAVRLAQHPEARQCLVDEPRLIPAAIEEMLRIDAPAQALPRTTLRDVELHGERIPEGSRLLVSYGAANLDDRVFAEPERFDIRREDNRHLSLGHGPHFCMGASLARLEARVAFEELLARYPEYVLEEEPGWVTSRWARSHPEVLVRLAP
jgi:cytochrome P450